MSIKTDHRSLYLQVIDKIKQDIETGIYEEGEKLPSEFELSRQLGISRATLREALRLLEDENIVVRRHGVGTFVRARALFSSGIEELYSVTEMIKRGGQKPGVIFLSSYKRKATEEEAEKFKLNHEQAEVYEIKRVRTADDKPVIYCFDIIPTNLLTTNTEYDQDSLFDFIERETNRTISYAVTYLEPLGYHNEISPVPECSPDTSLLSLKQMHYDEQDHPVLYSYNYFRADKFNFHVVRRRV